MERNRLVPLRVQIRPEVKPPSQWRPEDWIGHKKKPRLETMQACWLWTEKDQERLLEKIRSQILRDFGILQDNQWQHRYRRYSHSLKTRCLCHMWQSKRRGFIVLWIPTYNKWVLDLRQWAICDVLSFVLSNKTLPWFSHFGMRNFQIILVLLEPNLDGFWILLIYLVS